MGTQFEVVKRPDYVGRGVQDDPLVTDLMKTMTNGKAVRVQHDDGGVYALRSRLYQKVRMRGGMLRSKQDGDNWFLWVVKNGNR